METTSTTVYYRPDSNEDFFRKRHNTTISFVIGLLLFLLPFAELRCGGMTLMNNSGLGLAIGSEWKVVMGGNKLMDKMNDGVKDEEARKALSGGMNIFLLVAIASAVFGLGVGYSEQKWKHVAVMFAGILSCLMIIAMMIQLNILLKSGLSKTNEIENKDLQGMSDSIGSVLKMKYTIWCYLSLGCFAVAAFLGFKKNKIEMEDAIRQAHQFDFQRQQQAEGNNPV